MREGLKSLIALVDAMATRVQMAVGLERAGLVSLMFHHVFEDDAEVARDLVDPQEGLTLAAYRTIIEYFLGAGFRFVTAADIGVVKRNSERLIMLTFDDGYRNNLRILPLLEEYGVPASIFVTSGHVKTGQGFWWDTVHRGWSRRKNKADPHAGSERAKEHRRLLHATKEATDAYLVANYGEDALQPVSDLDRPLSPAELRDLADHPLVLIGSHTVTHARLPSLDEQTATYELSQCRDDLLELTGSTPEVLSYPYSACSAETVKLARACGYQYGIRGLPTKVALPVVPGSWRALQLGRFGVHAGRGDLEQQCASLRSDVSVLAALRSRRAFKV